MCGKRYGHGLRSILIISLLVLALPWALYSESALDEIIPILNSYVQITESLYDRSNVFEKDLKNFKTTMQEANKSLFTLESNYKEQKSLLDNQTSTLTEHTQTLKGYSKQINDLETGYSNMERSLKVYKVIGNVSIGIAIGSLIVTGFVLFAN